MQKPTLSLVTAAMAEIQPAPTIQKDSEPRRCCLCLAAVPLADDSPRWRELDIKCEACESSHQSTAEKQKTQDMEFRRDALLSAIPTAFRKTERARLPQPDRLDVALAWEYGATGLLIYGPTGCGKSRVAWEVAKREVLAGRTLKHVNAFELSRYPSLFMADSGAASKFADELVNTDLLLLDDVFKAKPTERVEELLFGVIDERGGWERPCIITVNDTGETLAERLSGDRGPALIRRLREYCQTIKF